MRPNIIWDFGYNMEVEYVPQPIPKDTSQYCLLVKFDFGNSF